MSEALAQKVALLIGAGAAILAGVKGVFTMLPERRKTIVDTQIATIENLWKENARQAQLIATLESEVQKLKDEVRGDHEKITRSPLL